MGFQAVSFYVDWGIVEGNPGHVVLDGVFSLEQFFSSASEAGIYLLARPGPYINAETASGGFPGWVDRIQGVLRSTAPDYLNATQNYVSTINGVISQAQITNGGPVILVQPENEYATFAGVPLADFPTQMNREYMAFVEQQFRDAGIVLPLFVNDNEVRGNWAPGSGLGSVDIYGIDAYPLRYDCGDPYTWPTYEFPTNWQITHEVESPTTPFVIAEFQGGAGDGWGGVGEDMCAILINDQAVRVLFKNNYSYGVKLFNTYMIYGGTNWGNLGYMGGYTSYDYGASITEDRHIWREKYSEMKLESNFFKVSPAYLTANPGNQTNGTLASTPDIGYTPLMDTLTDTKFYVVRHSDFTSMANTMYNFTFQTSVGDIVAPQLGGSLLLQGRDAKIFVSDYNVGGINLLYSTADIYTWTNATETKKIMLVYGEADETHELALPCSLGNYTVEDQTNAKVQQLGDDYVVNWQVTPARQVVHFGDELEIHLLWRNDAFNHWVVELPAAAPTGNFTSPSKSTAIVKAGYLIRSASISGDELSLVGDINSTTTFELISAPAAINTMTFNGSPLNTTTDKGRLTATLPFTPPRVALPDFTTAEWRYIDSLPEIQSTYDDTLWTSCDHTTTTNPRNLTTPTSLYASDYGYHAGSLIYRGHFTATGAESTFFVNVTGGSGFGHSVWLNDTFLGSWTGSGANESYPQTFTFPSVLNASAEYVITVLIDHTGQDEEAPGTDAVKYPRGILNYNLSGHALTDVTWKITGNLGGEQYYDLARGPRNEGAMYAERQGFHLPQPPSGDWEVASPIDQGVAAAGIGFFSANFTLDVPEGYDVPMSFVFNDGMYGGKNATVNYRVQLFVNGYQFGKYGTFLHLLP